MQPDCLQVRAVCPVPDWRQSCLPGPPPLQSQVCGLAQHTHTSQPFPEAGSRRDAGLIPRDTALLKGGTSYLEER